jgi:hypothetical protein
MRVRKPGVIGIFDLRKTRFYAIDFQNRKGAAWREAAATEASPPGRVSAIQPDTRADTRSNFFIWIPRNSLKRPEPANGIQGNPSLFIWNHLVFAWFCLHSARPEVVLTPPGSLWLGQGKPVPSACAAP